MREDKEFIDFMQEWSRNKSKQQAEIARKRDLLLSGSNYHNQAGVFQKLKDRKLNEVLQRRSNLREKLGLNDQRIFSAKVPQLSNNLDASNTDGQDNFRKEFLQKKSKELQDFARTSIESKILQNKFHNLKAKNSEILQFKPQEPITENNLSLSAFSTQQNFFRVPGSVLPLLGNLDMKRVDDEMTYIQSSLSKKGVNINGESLGRAFRTPGKVRLPQEVIENYYPKRGNFLQNNPWAKEEKKKSSKKKK